MGRKSKADQRRIEIIEGFFQCVADQGIANSSVRKIATAAGVQPSTLHHYFKNKEEIIEQAVKVFTDRILDQFQQQLNAMVKRRAVSGREKVDLGLAFIFSQGMINDRHTGFFLECCAASRHNVRIKAMLANLFVRFRQAIIMQLEQIPGFDRLPAARQKLLSSTIVAIHEGIELQWFADPASVSLDATLEITREMISFFIDHADPILPKGG